MKLWKDKNIDWKLLEKAENFISANGSTLAFVCGLVGFGVSLYAAFRASDEVSDIRENYDKDLRDVQSEAISEPEKAVKEKNLKTMRDVRYILAYKWVLLSGGSSIALMFLSKYIDGMAITGLTALAATNQEKLKKFGENAKKMLGEEKFKDLEDRVLEEKILKNFVAENGEPLAFRMPYNHNGDLFVETQDGRLFQMQKDELEESLKWGKDYCARNEELSKEKLFSHFGIAPEEGANYEYWGPENPFDAYIGQRELCGCTFQTVEYRRKPRVRTKSGRRTK